MIFVEKNELKVYVNQQDFLSDLQAPLWSWFSLCFLINSNDENYKKFWTSLVQVLYKSTSSRSELNPKFIIRQSCFSNRIGRKH
jgi:hypothetical protein